MRVQLQPQGHGFLTKVCSTANFWRNDAVKKSFILIARTQALANDRVDLGVLSVFKD